MQPTRRPLRSRDSRWAAAVAGFLARQGVRPDAISVASVVFAAAAGLSLWMTGTSGTATKPWFFLGAAVMIQLRLLCNLFDGMVAIEGGFKTKSGEVFNELPDRFADAFILIGTGYSVLGSPWMPLLGWLGAVLAVLTAYVRALGAYTGAGQQFCGPMAKPHRMALITVACVASAALAWMDFSWALMPWALALLAIGCVITVFRRTYRILQELERQ